MASKGHPGGGQSTHKGLEQERPGNNSVWLVLPDPLGVRKYIWSLPAACPPQKAQSAT